MIKSRMEVKMTRLMRLGCQLHALAAAALILAAVGTTVALSGLGFVIAGPIAAAIAGAGATGLAAGLIGALADWGIPEERLRQYEAEIHDGGILVGLASRSPEDARRVAEQWVAIGGQHVHA